MKGRQWSPEGRLSSVSEAFRNVARSAEMKKTTVSRLSGRLLDTGDTSTVTAVCGFHLADRISQDSMTLYSVMFIVLN